MMEIGQQQEDQAVSVVQQSGNTGKARPKYVKRSLALTLVGVFLLHSFLGNNGSEARTVDHYGINNPPVPVIKPLEAPKPQAVESREIVVKSVSKPAFQIVDGAVRKGDSLVSLMNRYGVGHSVAMALAVDLKKHSRIAREMQIGDAVKLAFDNKKNLLAFGYQVDAKRILLVTVAKEDEFIVRNVNYGLNELNQQKLAQLFPVVAKQAEETLVEEVVVKTTPAMENKPVVKVEPVVAKEEADNKPVAVKAGEGEVAQKLNAMVNTGSANIVEVKVRKGDGLADLLARNSVSQETTMAIAKAAKPVYDLASQLTPGKTINLAVGEEGGLMGLSYAVDPEHTFWLVRLAKDGTITAAEETKRFVPQLEKKELDARPTVVSVTIRSSLFEDGRKAGLSHTNLVKLAGLFEWDVDFAKDIQPGDRFKVVFEEMYHKGKQVKEGVILAAEFVNQGKVYRVFRYSDPSGKVGYFTPEGNSIRRMFIKAPMDITRISSGFSSNRKHPILGYNRAHKGVDYAAPSGTPVRSSGDGVVESVGPRGAFGNLIVVRHNSTYSTAYAHLSKFEAGIKAGSHVTQGQVIGRVGTTGISTGPHLHYEVRVKGEAVNPLSIKPSFADSVDRKHMAGFKKNANSYVAMLEGGSSVVAKATTGRK
ncbi:MAG: peptidoglycan DD-metalloendopeptidase family protein [Magnetococcales bacterium]|nr:peptidoglycan DD-metalloendopeptidase family protein [Magnetococcales bacterium]NGZ27709.1 peptidoglycan DD-metalloendopeptidase family protein [Magnetococcales bacterium]